MAAKKNIKMKVGDTYILQFRYKPDGVVVDLSTYTVLCQVRETNTSAVLMTPTFTYDVDGWVTATFSATNTSAITVASALYDIQITKAGIVETILEGNITFLKDVSR